MPPPERSVARSRGRLAAATRHHGSDADVTCAAARDHAAEMLAAYVQRVVDEAPPLTDEQRNKIAALLRPVPKPGGGRAA